VWARRRLQRRNEAIKVLEKEIPRFIERLRKTNYDLGQQTRNEIRLQVRAAVSI
jgi:IQ calmodulin-binding motif